IEDRELSSKSSLDATNRLNSEANPILGRTTPFVGAVVEYSRRKETVSTPADAEDVYRHEPCLGCAYGGGNYGVDHLLDVVCRNISQTRTINRFHAMETAYVE